MTWKKGTTKARAGAPGVREWYWGTGRDSNFTMLQYRPQSQSPQLVYLLPHTAVAGKQGQVDVTKSKRAASIVDGLSLQGFLPKAGLLVNAALIINPTNLSFLAFKFISFYFICLACRYFCVRMIDLGVRDTQW